LGLHVRMRATASGQPGGTVVQQQPRPGEVVAEGSLVTLWVSNGASASQMVMPNLIGLTMSQAARLLAHAHVTMASPSSEYSTEPPDTIIDQSPAPYASLQGVTTVSVTLSHGPSPVSASLPINHSTVRWKIPASAAPKSLFKVVVTDPAGNEEIFYQQVNPGQRVTYRVVWYGTQGQMVVSLNGRLIPTPPLKSMVSASPSPSPSSSPSPSGSPSPSPSASLPAPSSNQSG
jgi:beta-lactam-binding protein with PASTA domain